MSDIRGDWAWCLFVELRKEIVDSQKVRAQAIGFKITFVSAVTGVIVSNRAQLPDAVLVIPALAAIFFDFLITSYSFAVKRIGFYVRCHLEPHLRLAFDISRDTLLWEQFMTTRRARQTLSMVGNLGLTLLSVAAACIGLFRPFYPVLSPLLLTALLVLFVLDAGTHWVPRRFRDDRAVAPPSNTPLQSTSSVSIQE